MQGLGGTTVNAMNLQEAAAAAARGKRSKKKKVLTKYAHQDEEDRQLAMQLLASTGQAAIHELSSPTQRPTKRPEDAWAILGGS